MEQPPLPFGPLEPSFCHKGWVARQLVVLFEAICRARRFCPSVGGGAADPHPVIRSSRGDITPQERESAGPEATGGELGALGRAVSAAPPALAPPSPAPPLSFLALRLLPECVLQSVGLLAPGGGGHQELWETRFPDSI
eukprot:gene24359-biopygen5913